MARVQLSTLAVHTWLVARLLKTQPNALKLVVLAGSEPGSSKVENFSKFWHHFQALIRPLQPPNLALNVSKPLNPTVDQHRGAEIKRCAHNVALVFDN